MLRRAADYDGHWSVSVAESPYDPSSYSIYIKSIYFILFWFILLIVIGSADTQSHSHTNSDRNNRPRS